MRRRRDARASHPLWKAFTLHRAGAKYRGIAFLLSFEQWLSMWEKSGKLDRRGKGQNNFVMARFGDKGPYKLGNVKIITGKENVSEAFKGKPIKPRSAEHREKLGASISKAKKGASPPPFSKEHRANIAKARTGKRWSAEQKERMSKNWHLRRRC